MLTTSVNNSLLLKYINTLLFKKIEEFNNKIFSCIDKTSPFYLSGEEALNLIEQIDNDNIEITFTFTNIPRDNELYVWIITNPNAETGGEVFIYPRGPIFRGLPVDYRNGILYHQEDNKHLKATFLGPIIGVDFEEVRILAYSREGNSIIDKFYNIQQNKRM